MKRTFGHRVIVHGEYEHDTATRLVVHRAEYYGYAWEYSEGLWSSGGSCTEGAGSSEESGRSNQDVCS